jgi:hypothetical protein
MFPAQTLISLVSRVSLDQHRAHDNQTEFVVAMIAIAVGQPHFSLRNLLIAVAIIAGLLGVARYFPWHVCGLVLFISTPLVWYWLLINSSPQAAVDCPCSRRKLRADRFRCAFAITLPFVSASSLISYWHTYYAPLYDGSRYFGWPLSFALSAQNGPTDSKLDPLFLDIAIYIAISFIVASVMKDGPRGFQMRLHKFLRGRTRAKKRPNQDPQND